MISVAAALARIRDSFAPLPAELVGLNEGLGRVLAEDLASRRTQPPFAVSAMDGYAGRAGGHRRRAETAQARRLCPGRRAA
ncbi:MAG: hypothetical protein WDN69_33280 [Aliidongia sp.]